MVARQSRQTLGSPCVDSVCLAGVELCIVRTTNSNGNNNNKLSSSTNDTLERNDTRVDSKRAQSKRRSRPRRQRDHTVPHRTAQPHQERLESMADETRQDEQTACRQICIGAHDVGCDQTGARIGRARRPAPLWSGPDPALVEMGHRYSVC